MTFLKNFIIRAITNRRRFSAARMSKQDERNYPDLTSTEKSEIKQLWTLKIGGGAIKELLFRL